MAEFRVQGLGLGVLGSLQELQKESFRCQVEVQLMDNSPAARQVCCTNGDP